MFIGTTYSKVQLTSVMLHQVNQIKQISNKVALFLEQKSLLLLFSLCCSNVMSFLAPLVHCMYWI